MDDAAPHRQWLVLGGDVGGTTTRIVVTDRVGRVLGRGVAAGGNPVSHPQTAAAAFGRALSGALEGADPTRVRGAVVGLAGGSALHDPAVRERFQRAWSDAGLRCAPRYASDLEVAFASGSTDPDGSVLIAGTGAVAGEIRGHRLVRTVGGHGWLLGDDGSGFWVGREAVRAALRALDDGDPASAPLVESVLRSLDIDADDGDRHRMRAELIRTVNARPPVRLAELAPLVTTAHAAADPVAGDIVDEAARWLAETLTRLGAPHRSEPVVLAGSLAGPDTPVGAALRCRLAGWSSSLLTAHDGTAGAAWLALAAADPSAATPEVLALLAASPTHG